MADSRICSVADCGKSGRIVRGMCMMHYTRWYKHGDSSVVAAMVGGASGECRIDGCKRSAVSRGWCNSHYMRWLRRGTTDVYGPGAAWLKDRSETSQDECLIWPFYRRDEDGYGRLTQNGRPIGAHRLMCLIAHGKPPSSKHQAAHNCGNGNLGCVNPNHLRWATQTENSADMVIHGTTRKGAMIESAVLTPDSVRAMRLEQSNFTYLELAEKYDVSIGTAWNAVNRRTWKHVK